MSYSSMLLKTADKLKGTQVFPWYRFFQKTLTWTTEQVKAYQLSELKKLIRHAWNTTPYYRHEFYKLGLNSGDIRDLQDLKRLSILDRDSIQNNRERLISTEYSEKQLHKGSSSGTTGIPITYFTDNRGLSAGIAAGYALWELSGWKPGQRNVHIWGNQMSVKRWSSFPSKLKSLAFRQLNIASTSLNHPENLDKIVKKIIQFDPISIEGYTGSIYTLAEYFEENNIRLKSLQRVLTTAENLESYQRSLIERVMAPIGDLYGSGEILGVAANPINQNRYFVMDPHVILETTESGIPGLKNLLITDLHNYGMPMIRYKVGDLIDDLQPASPNNGYPFRSFRKIKGRSSHIITLPNGKKFHPINIFGGTLFRKFRQITRHKVKWNGRQLNFIFETQSYIDKSAVLKELKSLLRPFDVDFKITYTSRILPSKNGKYKFMEFTNAL